jgi:uncharacterized protein
MGFAFNRTRRAYLATHLHFAQSHWSRFRGLMCTPTSDFGAGQGLWIDPSHGVHTFAMRFPIDVVYLSRDKTVVHLEQHLKPWRVAPVRLSATSVLELPVDTLRSTGTVIGDSIEIEPGPIKETATT